MQPLRSIGLFMDSTASRVVTAIVLAASLGLHGEAMGQQPRIGQRVDRQGDEIVVCGERYHTTTPVVLWTDPGGYDAYRLERRFVPLDQANTPPAQKKGQSRGNRFSMRRKGLTEVELEACSRRRLGLAAAAKSRRSVRHPL